MFLLVSGRDVGADVDGLLYLEFEEWSNEDIDCV